MTDPKIFIEYGIDFDHNRYGFGRSTEIEYADGREFRTCEKLVVRYRKTRYIRIWVGKAVLVIDSGKPHWAFVRKKRWNFKIVFGISGYPENMPDQRDTNR